MSTKKLSSMISSLSYTDVIAETYWHLHQQEATAWTLELDLRPSAETF